MKRIDCPHRDECDYIDTIHRALGKYISRFYEEDLPESEVYFLMRQIRLQSQWMFATASRVLESQDVVSSQSIREGEEESNDEIRS